MKYLVDQDGNEYYPQANGTYAVDTESGIIFLRIEERQEKYITSSMHTEG